MDPSKKSSNKIRDIVRLQQLLRKWKQVARANRGTPTAGGGSKSIKFLRKTLSFSDSPGAEGVPKGFLAVCVGKELKRYVIRTEHLSHQAFGVLLREAEEEFGFHQEGVLRIPCEVGVFEMILNLVREKEKEKENAGTRCSPDFFTNSPAHPQLCR